MRMLKQLACSNVNIFSLTYKKVLYVVNLTWAHWKNLTLPSFFVKKST